MEGREVGQYRIIEQLGAGGMGIVYKAHDTRLDRTVALKFLPPHLNSDETSKKRFIQEARAASALDHANICTIHDIDEDEDGKLYIVMSYYDGQTLKYVLDEGPVSVENAVLFGSQIAAGLARAHEAGIVHRDMKPANIMVTERGEIKILDFGIAKLSEGIDLTKTGSTVGTAAYMSPEQAKGESVDRRSDIWSVGVLLYEMITGKQPFDGSYEAALIYGIVNAPHDPIDVEMPDGLSELIDRCLSKDPKNRFDSSVELSEALGAFTSSSSSGITVAAPAAAAVPAASAVTGSETTVLAAEAGDTDPSGIKELVKQKSVLKVLGLFSIASVVVLGVVYAGMIELGLPDWVFPTGVVLMILGLPVILLGARNDAAASGAWLTLRKAVQGGILSLVLFALFSTGYMVMRAAGIGPAASLQSSGALEENAKLLIADFENRTSDERLAESVTEALRIDLSQSNVIQLMGKSDLVSVLNRMNRPSDSKMDINTAMEIAAREGVEAVIVGEISSLGAGFVVSARLIAAHNGAELIALRENASDDSGIIGAVDRLSARLREEIGESIKEIRSNPDLDRVTTSSLDALRLFSEARAREAVGDQGEAVELLERAVEIDPTFAMAYRKMGAVYGNMGRIAKSTEAARRAFELRDNLPERERGLTAAFYYSSVEMQIDRSVEEYENVLSKYPNEGAALNNVSITYNFRGQHALAEKHLRHALEIGNYTIYYNNQLYTLAAQEKTEAADSVLVQLKIDHPDHPITIPLEALSMINRGSYDRADSILAERSNLSDPGWEAFIGRFGAQNDAMHGRIESARKKLSVADKIYVEDQDSLRAFLNLLSSVNIELDILGDADAAQKSLSQAVNRYPIASLAILDRPYDLLIGLYSRLGDTIEARRLLTEYHEQVPDDLRSINLIYGGTSFGEAELAAAEGDPNEAADLYASFKEETGCIYCMAYRSAVSHERAGRMDGAIYFYQVASTMAVGIDDRTSAPLKPLAFLRLGEIYSERGETDNAIESYTKFAELWKNADTELQDQVRYAHNRIDQLLKQAAREPQ
ncbi:MAG: serine/threonine protein kinase [Bacteroidetes bacterium]|nr:MAG: serine/threonine protein kinase [Bacteroidota bacterium]